MIFETHAHYDDDRFDEDRDKILKSLPEAGIGIVVNSGASVESTRETIELAKKYAHVYAAVGIHPSEIAELDEDFFDWMKAQTAWEKTVAIGEIGLDYYWDKEPEVQERQRDTGLDVRLSWREKQVFLLSCIPEMQRQIRCR